MGQCFECGTSVQIGELAYTVLLEDYYLLVRHQVDTVLSAPEKNSALVYCPTYCNCNNYYLGSYLIKQLALVCRHKTRLIKMAKSKYIKQIQQVQMQIQIKQMQL